MKEHQIFTCIHAKVGHLETIHIIVIQRIRKYTKICM